MRLRTPIGMAASNILMFENESMGVEIPKEYNCSPGEMVGSIGCTHLKPKQKLVHLNCHALF